MQDIKFICKRKGGNGKKSLSHSEWCQTVLSQPDVISMSFVPITSLLGGINGSGYLTHAMNLYLRCKQLSVTPLAILYLHFKFYLDVMLLLLVRKTRNLFLA